MNTIPNVRDITGIVTALGVVTVAYLLYRAYRFTDKVADAATQPIADAYVRITSGPGAKTVSVVRFEDGRRIAMQDIIDSGGSTQFSNGALYLTYRGISYEITGRNDQGEYLAVKL